MDHVPWYSFYQYYYYYLSSFLVPTLPVPPLLLLFLPGMESVHGPVPKLLPLLLSALDLELLVPITTAATLIVSARHGISTCTSAEATTTTAVSAGVGSCYYVGDEQLLGAKGLGHVDWLLRLQLLESDLYSCRGIT